MGVANSKREYSNEPDEPGAKGESSGESTGGPTGGPSGESTGGPSGDGENKNEKEKDTGEEDKNEAEKWKPFFKDLLKLPQVKDKIETSIINDRAAKGETEYGKKGIIISKNDIVDFTNGVNNYVADLILFLKPAGLGLPNKKGEPPVKFDQAVADKLTTGEQTDNNGKQIRNLKPDTKFNDVDKTIVDPLIEAAKLALKHDKFLRVLKDYILKTDTFKNAHEKAFINDKEHDLKQGDLTVANALEETKEKKTIDGGAASAAPLPEGGGYGSDSGSGSDGSDSGSDGGSDSSIYSSGSDVSSDSVGGADILEGGLSFTDKQRQKNKGKQNYKNFKEESRKSFDERSAQFFSDTLAVDTFMEENEDKLLALMYYQRGVPGKWIDKSKDTEKKKVADALLKVITEYKPPTDKAGEGEGEGEEKTIEKADTPKAEPEGADENVSTTDDAPPEDKGEEKPTQGGGGGKSITKKKKFTRKKPQRINISINVGNKNSISDSESCSSDSRSSSDSDSDSSSDSTSSSDSDSTSTSSDSSSDSDSTSSSSSSDSSTAANARRKKKYRVNKKRTTLKNRL